MNISRGTITSLTVEWLIYIKVNVDFEGLVGYGWDEEV